MNVVCRAQASQKVALAALFVAWLAACAGSRTGSGQVHVLTGSITEGEAPFFSAPWPDDRRLHADGTVSTLNFPNPGGGDGLAGALKRADHLLKGWGINAPIYLPFSGAIDPSSLPTDPRDVDGSVFLLDIDPTSPQRGTRHPVDFHFHAEKTLFLAGNVLAVRPVPGFPLRPKTRYAAVVTTAVRDLEGNAIVAGAFAGGLVTGSWWAPLRDELNREGFPLERVAGATTFTTQPILDELLVLRDYLLSVDLPEPLVPDLHLMTGRSPDEPFWLFEGHYLAPHMQHGTLPYVPEGGDFQFDASGKPVPDFQESMRIAVVIPKGPPPLTGFPVSLYSHGTGGTFESIIRQRNSIGSNMAKQGIAGFGIDQVLTGPRSGNTGVPCYFQSVEYCYIDYLNPIAGRNNLRQAALDNVFLRRVAQSLTIPAELHPEGYAVSFDQRRFGFVGHSQGGFTGALYTAIDADLWGSVFSGSGGLMTGTILVRKIPDAKALIEGSYFLNIAGTESLDWYHPALAMIQTINEVVDPVSYAPYWVREPVGRAKNIYATSGLVDQFTWPVTAEFLAAAGGLPRMAPIVRPSSVLDLTGLDAVTAPLAGNINGVTAAFRQFEGDGHYAVFDDPKASAQWPAFMRSMLVDGAATIPADQ